MTKYFDPELIKRIYSEELKQLKNERIEVKGKNAITIINGKETVGTIVYCCNANLGFGTSLLRGDNQ